MNAPRLTKADVMAEAVRLYPKLAADYTVSDVYPYRYADSVDAFMRVRFDRKPEANAELRDKEIRALHWNGEKHAHGEGAKRDEGKPLYRLPELAQAMKADPSCIVWIVEGEKCAEALRRVGEVATTSGAASSASAADWSPLSGRSVRLWPDNDESGAQYADTAYERLRALGCVVERVDVSKLALPEKGDVVDWLAANDAQGLDALPILQHAAEPKGQAERVSVQAVDDEVPRVILIRGSDVTPEPIDWLWRGWLAAGKLHLIGGQPGTGKTTIATALAASVTDGGNWPDGSRVERGSVVIWSGEDDVRDTLSPRMQAAGANMARVHFLEGVRQKGERYPFDPAEDTALLADALAGIPDVRLLVVDPIVSAVAGDSHKNAEVRRGLQPLVDLAQRHRCALLGVTHFTKGTAGREPVERITGSLAFGALARLVMVTAKQEADGDRPERRVLLRAKSNLGPDGGGFVYDLRQGPLASNPLIEASRVEWGESVEGSARELLAEAEDRAEDARDDAPGFLRELLSYGSRPAKDIYREAESAGFSRDSMKRAKRKVGAEAVKAGMLGGWEWRLPKSEGSAVMPKGREECTQFHPLPSHPSGDATPPSDTPEGWVEFVC